MTTSAKLLLAEDSLTIQKVFAVTFQQSGISLTMVDNGIDAVRLAREISPDLVVADVSLPGKDGFHVASELRSPAAGVSCPVLILAGTLSPFDEERFKSCGANGVLFKPFEYQELIDKVEALIRGPKEPVPAPGEKERLTPSAEEPWDFSDILSEAQQEAGAASVSPSVKADDHGRAAPSSGVGAGGTLSLGDFDVSLEDIEGKPERKETAPRPPPRSRKSRTGSPPPRKCRKRGPGPSSISKRLRSTTRHPPFSISPLRSRRSRSWRRSISSRRSSRMRRSRIGRLPRKSRLLPLPPFSRKS